jgi:phosphoribosylformimino-5-aminoimidazole carboxamide ribotide isomerase
MIACPAVDLRGGCAVQLVGGVPGSERVRLDDPVRVARHWVALGFRRLHVVDLDAALGDGDNRQWIRRILAAVDVPVQVGGGIRGQDDIARLLDAGAERVITGTRAVADRSWLEAVSARWPGRVAVASDCRRGRVLTMGWRRTTPLALPTFLASLDPLPLAGVLVTDVQREGRARGVNGRLFRTAVRATRHGVIAAGGVAAAKDMRTLEAAGAAGAVIGIALYAGTLDAPATAREFGA